MRPLCAEPSESKVLELTLGHLLSKILELTLGHLLSKILELTLGHLRYRLVGEPGAALGKKYTNKYIPE